MDLKLEELSSLLNISEEIVYDLIHKENIPHYKICSEYRFGIEEIENWILNNQEFLNGINQKKEFLTSSSKEGFFKYSLFRAIYKGNFFCDLDISSKKEVFLFVCNYLSQHFPLDANVLFELLLDREELMTTGLGHGFALPHTRDCYLNTNYDIVVAVRLKNPIEYHALDGLPVTNLFFLFSANNKSHLNLVNKIVVLNANPNFHQDFEFLKEKKDLLSYVKNWEMGLKI